MIHVYAWIYEGPFHTSFLSSTTILSVLSNGLLLFIIFTTNSKGIGSYRYLLAVFASCDVLTSFAHLTLQPIMHLTSSGVYFFPRNGEIMIGGQSFDTIFVLLFIATYYQTFLILAYHYVYRFKAVASGITHSFTDSWSISRWVTVCVVINVLYISSFVGTCALAFSPDNQTRALAPPEIEELYGVDLQNRNTGFAGIVMKRPSLLSGEMMWHFPAVLGSITLVGIFGATAIVVAYCIWRTNTVIRSTDNILTAKTRKMHQNLFHALLIQSAIPMLFNYFPLGVIYAFPPFTGISLGAFGNILYLITVIFPSIDAFFVLYFITRFRVAVIQLFRLSSSRNNVSNGTTSEKRQTDSNKQ